MRLARLSDLSQGHDGLREFFAGFAELLTFDLQLSDVRNLGDRVLGLGTIKTVAKGSGIEPEGSLAIVASFEGGLCTHLRDYGDSAKALKALGLSE